MSLLEKKDLPELIQRFQKMMDANMSLDDMRKYFHKEELLILTLFFYKKSNDLLLNQAELINYEELETTS